MSLRRSHIGVVPHGAAQNDGYERELNNAAEEIVGIMRDKVVLHVYLSSELINTENVILRVPLILHNTQIIQSYNCICLK